MNKIMTYNDLLKKNNVSKFKDIKKLLNKNNIFVQDISGILDVYMILYKKKGPYNDFSKLFNECHGSIYEKDTNRLISSSSYQYSIHTYDPYKNNNSFNKKCAIFFWLFIFIIFLIYKNT